jgi:hypothetical protein
MLTTDSGLEAVAYVRKPFSVGACLPSAIAGTAQPRKGAIAFARPRAFWAADGFGRRHPAAGSAMALQQPNPSKQNYPYTTRIAASGGTKGPHPAREPDPV